MKIAVAIALFVAGCASQHGATQANLVDANNASPLGEVIYKKHCADCHGARGEGDAATPAVMGKGALVSGDEKFKDGQQLFRYVAEKMPDDAPGSLSIRDYWAVVTYLVGGNGIKVPQGGLSDSNAASVKLDHD
jgi:S-disulfanyl-L-cysteine oxidoreductase SoxD